MPSSRASKRNSISIEPEKITFDERIEGITMRETDLDELHGPASLEKDNKNLQVIKPSGALRVKVSSSRMGSSPRESIVGSEHHLLVIDTIDSTKNLMNGSDAGSAKNSCSSPKQVQMTKPESYVPVPEVYRNKFPTREPKKVARSPKPTCFNQSTHISNKNSPEIKKETDSVIADQSLF